MRTFISIDFTLVICSPIGYLWDAWKNVLSEMTFNSPITNDLYTHQAFPRTFLRYETIDLMLLLQESLSDVFLRDTRNSFAQFRKHNSSLNHILPKF